jgi:hypothetical protein
MQPLQATAQQVHTEAELHTACHSLVYPINKLPSEPIDAAMPRGRLIRFTTLYTLAKPQAHLSTGNKDISVSFR